MTENKILIEVKYNSVLNQKQQKLYDNTDAKEKIVIDSIDSFLKLKI